MVQRQESGKGARKTSATSRKGSQNCRGRKASAGGDGRLLLILSLILLASLALFIYSYLQYRPHGQSGILGASDLNPGGDQLPQGSIADGVRFRSLNLGGLSFQDAAGKLRESEEKLVDLSGRVRLKYAKEELSKSLYELGMRLDVEAILNDAKGIAKTTAYAQKELTDSHLRLDEAAFTAGLEALKKEIDQEGKDAECTGFDFENEKFIFDKEKEGREFTVAENRDKLAAALKAGRFNEPIELKVKLTEPGRSAEKLSEKLGFIASASTPIAYYDESRNRNVQLAADRIHGTIIPPHESFSYNKCIGPMTLENGFVEAGVQDAEGNDARGIGGGLCQPSTTLYQAAVRANLAIDVHNFHSTPVGYCPIGTDAMVSEWSDLVISNPTDYPYAIAAYFDGGTLSFSFYGPPNPDGAVIDLYVEELDSKEVEGDPKVIQDSSVPENETSYKVEPRPDRHVKVYRTYTVNGMLLRSELMYDHTYPGTPGVVASADAESLKASLSGESLPSGGSSTGETTAMPTVQDSGESTFLVPVP